MTVSELLNWWQPAVALFGFVVWLVRLEMKVIQTQKDIKESERRAAERRAEDLTNHQRSWDKMEAVLNSVQSDIKELLQRTSK